MRKLTTILFFISILSYLTLAQESISKKQDSQEDKPFDSETLKKSNEILSQARKAIRKGNESLKIDSLTINYSVSRQMKFVRNDNKSTTNQEDSGEIVLNLSLPDKYKFAETTGDANTSTIYNYILNGDQLENETYGISNGRRMEFQINGQGQPTAEQKQRTFLRVKKLNSLLLFPIILESPAYPLEFHYIGKAEADGQRADVLEAVLHDESSLRLFLDEQSHLIKLLINTGKYPQGGEYEEKRFLSDYKENSGLMVASKINIESNQSTKFGNAETYEEMIVKSFKINPTFKPNFFEVKK